MSVFVSHSQQDEAVYSNFCLALMSPRVRQRFGESFEKVLRPLAAADG